MGPVFIRRGKVLFLIKSPTDFLKGLKTGKLRPTDHILVKDKGETEWIPIQQIRQFQVGINSENSEINPQSIFQLDDLFDHIRQPKFNFRALILGGFWYFLHGMPQRGFRNLILAAILSTGLFFLGNLIRIPLIILPILPLIGWFIAATYAAWRADHDLNKLQVERFHKSNSITARKIESEQVKSPVIGFPDPSIVPLKEKILN